MEKYITSITLFFTLFIAVNSSYAQVVNTSQGLLDFGHRKPGDDSAVHELAWFTPDAIIFEKKVFNSLEFDTGLYKGFDVFRYSYYDLINQKVYDYNYFSDTALPICKYDFNKESTFIYGIVNGAVFTLSKDSVTKLGDTCINHQTIKRLKYSERRPELGYRREDIYYFSPAGFKAANLHFDPVFEALLPDCTLTKKDIFTYYNDTMYVSGITYDIVRAELTPNEKNIFKKWAQNARDSKLPVLPFKKVMEIPFIPIKFRNHPTYKMMYPNL